MRQIHRQTESCSGPPKVRANHRLGHYQHVATHNGDVGGSCYFFPCLEPFFNILSPQMFNLILSVTFSSLLFLNGPTLTYFSFILGLFKQTIQFLQLINVKNVHSVFGVGIRTIDLQTQVISHNHQTRAPAQNYLLLVVRCLLISERRFFYSLETQKKDHVKFLWPSCVFPYVNYAQI